MLEIQELTYLHKDTGRGVENVSFKAQPGETVVLLGKSGSGKSTLLSLIYGLEDAQSGRVVYKGNMLSGPSENLVPGHKMMQLIRQDSKVLPNHTVYENIEESISKAGGEPNKGNIKAMLRAFGLDWDLDKKPSELSGGQQQKLAIARALAAEPEVLLLDEPFNHIDVLERSFILERVRDYVDQYKGVCVLATHSGEEAFDLAHKIVVLYEGKKIEEGTPQKCYNEPEFAVTAAFLGPINLFRTVQGQFASKGKKFLVRPVDISIDDVGHDHKVISSIPMGPGYLVKLRFSKTEVRYVYSSKPIEPGFNCGLRAKPQDYHEVGLPE